MYFHLSPWFKRHQGFFVFFFLLATFKGQKAEYLPSNAFKTTLVLMNVNSITLKSLTRDCSSISSPPVLTLKEYLVVRLHLYSSIGTLGMDLAPHLPCKESNVFDLSFTRVTPSAARCHRCGGTSSHSRRSSATRHLQWWGSIFNLVSSLSQFYVAPLTKSDKRRDSLSTDLSIFPGYFLKPCETCGVKEYETFRGALERGLRCRHYLRNVGCIRDSYRHAILDLSSPAGPAPIGSFIFALMVALDNGTAEKSPKSKGSTSDVTGCQLTLVDWCSRVQLETRARSISDVVKGRSPLTPTHSLTLLPKWDL